MPQTASLALTFLTLLFDIKVATLLRVEMCFPFPKQTLLLAQHCMQSGLKVLFESR